MSDANSLEVLLQQFLENRDSLSEEEMARLLEALRAQPPLAERLKDHLMMDELLAQQYTRDRQDFVGKFEQRLREENGHSAPGTPGNSSETYALRSPDHLESLSASPRLSANGSTVAGKPPETPPRVEKVAVSQPPHSPPLGSASHPWLTFFAVLGGLLLLAGGLLRLEYTDAARKIAQVEEVTGMVLIYRGEVGTVAAAGMPILPGDEIRVRDESQLTLAFRDQSRVTIDSDSKVVFQPGAAHWPGLLTSELGKELFVFQGVLEAEVVPQAPGRPMILQTPQLLAEVLGTRLIVAAEETQSRVEVIEGVVAVRSKHQPDPPVEIASGHQVVATKDKFRVSPGAWPSKREGLVFLLSPQSTVSRTPDQGVRVFAEGANQTPSILRPRRDARFEQGRMVFRGGAFLAEDPTASALLAACRETNALSLEATFQTDELSQTGPARLLTFSTSSHAWNFSLTQEGPSCVLRLLTWVVSQTEQSHEIPLFEIPDDQPHHVVVTYAPNQLRCYLDGKEIAHGAKVRGTFAAWKPQHLLFGDEWNGKREWKGGLAGVAIFNRVLSAKEAARNALHYRLQFPHGSNATETKK